MMNKINAKPFLFLSVQKTRLARAARKSAGGMRQYLSRYL